MCEQKVADYIAERDEWDFLTLEIGVNMRPKYTVEEFEQRVRYLITKVVKENPDKPVFIITIYPNFAQYKTDENNVCIVREKEFNIILRQVVYELKYKNLYLIEGKDILTDFTTLTADLIHPSDFGHILMGQNLAKNLNEILKTTCLKAIKEQLV